MATRQVITTQTTSAAPNHQNEVKEAAPFAALNQFVYWILGIMEAILLMRFAFRLFGANPAAPFVGLLYDISAVLMAPFRIIFPTTVAEGAIFEWSVLVAMFIYALIAWAIMRLVEIMYTAGRA